MVRARAEPFKSCAGEVSDAIREIAIDAKSNDLSCIHLGKVFIFLWLKSFAELYFSCSKSLPIHEVVQIYHKSIKA